MKVINQRNRLVELYLPQMDKFTVITCNKCTNDYVIYEAFYKYNEKTDNYLLIEMSETNYCPYCGSKGRE